MATTKLKFLSIPAISKTHTATVIFIHGLGDTGDGWQPAAEMLGRNPALSHIKWILPHAPRQRVTLNMGMMMPSWYDIYSLADDDLANREEDEKGLLASRSALNELITEEVESGTPPERIVLGGFSQGGVMTLLTGLTSERKLAGLAVLSGYLPLAQKIKSMMSGHALSLPIFWGHGNDDPLIPYKVAESSVDVLKERLGFPDKAIELRKYYGLGHSADAKELGDLANWLKTVLPAQ